jgi:hypothetical protein
MKIVFSTSPIIKTCNAKESFNADFLTKYFFCRSCERSTESAPISLKKALGKIIRTAPVVLSSKKLVQDEKRTKKEHEQDRPINPSFFLRRNPQPVTLLRYKQQDMVLVPEEYGKWSGSSFEALCSSNKTELI